jgi:Helitron helicase-like domain at N-terminus
MSHFQKEFRRRYTESEGQGGQNGITDNRSLVRITGSKIHSSPAERKMAISTLMSMVQFYGCPSIFFTFAPDDIHSILTLRMCCPTQNGNDKFPALDSSFEKMLRERDEKENDGSILNDEIDLRESNLHNLVTKNSIAAAEIFKITLETIFETVARHQT